MHAFQVRAEWQIHVGLPAKGTYTKHKIFVKPAHIHFIEPTILHIFPPSILLLIIAHILLLLNLMISVKM